MGTTPLNSRTKRRNDEGSVSKPDYLVRSAVNVNCVNKANVTRLRGHHKRMRSLACSKKPHTFQECAVRDTSRGKDDFLTRRKIVCVIDLIRIVNSHCLQSIQNHFPGRNLALVDAK